MSTPSQPATSKPSKSQRLLADAREAAELRAYRTHPDVAALAIERVRARVDALVWVGIVLGLAFTASNVASFAAQGAAPGSVPWLIAWLLDPMVSLCLVGTLLAESTLAKHQIKAGGWVRTAKWGLLTATYVMNTWASWASRDASAIVLHSVPPLVVFVMAEAITDLRDRLTDAVLAAHRYATTRATWDPTMWPQVGTDPATTRAVAAADQTTEPTAAPPNKSSGAAPVDHGPAREDQTDRTPPRPDRRAGRHEDHARRIADRTAHTTRASGSDRDPRTNGTGPDVADLLGPGEAVRARLAKQGQRLTRRALITGLREDGHSVSTDRAGALLKRLCAESADPTPAPTHTPARPVRALRTRLRPPENPSRGTPRTHEHQRPPSVWEETR